MKPALIGFVAGLVGTWAAIRWESGKSIVPDWLKARL